VSGFLAVGVTAAAVVTLMTLTVLSKGGNVVAVDDAIHGWVVEHRGDPDLVLARVVTVGGITTWTVPALAVVGVVAAAGRPWLGRLGAGVLLAAVAGVGMCTGLLVNNAVDRVRPPVADWAGDAGGPSFPSGHTTCATIVALSAAWALSSRVTSTRGRRVLWTVAVVWAFGVGWSRMWLGVHWPTDVLGGWLWGTAWFALAAAGATWLRNRRAARLADAT
jgi:undecaprenyl-diphosphatase